MTASLPVDVVSVIVTFAMEHPEVVSGDHVRDLCRQYSETFAQTVLDARPLADVEIVQGFVMEGDVIQMGHAATRVGHVVIDWTLRQFEPEARIPTITPYAVWRQTWRSL